MVWFVWLRLRPAKEQTWPIRLENFRIGQSRSNRIGHPIRLQIEYRRRSLLKSVNIVRQCTENIWMLMYSCFTLSSMSTPIISLMYPYLFWLAQDVTITPVSQTYYEQIFSICGKLTAGRHNWLANLYTRLFLKANRQQFKWTWVAENNWPICEAISITVICTISITLNCCLVYLQST